MSNAALTTRVWLSIALGAVLVAACGATGTTTRPGATPPASTPAPSAATPTTSAAAPTPSATVDPDALHMVVIGDSIPFGGHFCGGCTAFPDVYAKELEARLGHPVEVVNRSRDDSAGMDQIESQVTEEEKLRDEIAAADVVILSVGFNNAMPDPATGVGCKGDGITTMETWIPWLLAAKEGCLQDGLDTYAAQYDRIFSAITDLREGKPTVYTAINVHDGNLGSPDFRDANVSDAQKAAVDRWMIAWYDRWNEMLCGKAKQHDFACIDVYHAFNGPQGDIPNGPKNTMDGAHPSPIGHDLIASLLAKVDTTAIAR